MKEFGDYQFNIPNLPILEGERYENIFKVYEINKKDNNFYYFYNILKKVEMPSVFDKDVVDTLELDISLPWTTLSYRLYGTQHLWWLLFLINKPKNIFYAESGISLEYIKSEFIGRVIDNIQAQIPK